ncbi:MAG: HXXEE domain-containing protein [Candidatus Nanopelagicales bacterium]|nr:HXXEE domain-containing protein [Candidatus Nanopelagicales bacterium]
MDYAKINRLWQSSTLLLAPPLIVLLIWLRPSMDEYQWLLWLHLPLLMLHEAEEYVLAPISFQEFFNLKTFAGSKTNPDYPLDDGYVFQVNIVLAWPVIILGALLAPVAPWLGFSMIWFELIVNNIMHTVLFQGAKPSYNPGLITNSFLLLPYAMWTLLVAAGFFTPLDWLLSIVVGLGIVAFFGTKTRGRLTKMKTMEIRAAG